MGTQVSLMFAEERADCKPAAVAEDLENRAAPATPPSTFDEGLLPDSIVAPSGKDLPAKRNGHLSGRSRWHDGS